MRHWLFFCTCTFFMRIQFICAQFINFRQEAFYWILICDQFASCIISGSKQHFPHFVSVLELLSYPLAVQCLRHILPMHLKHCVWALSIIIVIIEWNGHIRVRLVHLFGELFTNIWIFDKEVFENSHFRRVSVSLIICLTLALLAEPAMMEKAGIIVDHFWGKKDNIGTFHQGGLMFLVMGPTILNIAVLKIGTT